MVQQHGSSPNQNGNRPQQAKQRVLIVGGGYGGLRVALRLAHLKQRQPQTNLEIVLLNMHDQHQVITELHQVAGGRTPADEVKIDFKQILRGCGVRFVLARATEFDFANQRVLVETTGADGRVSRGQIPYRWLVLAMGSTTAFFGIPGLKEHAYTLKSWWDAGRVAERMAANFAAAVALPVGDPRRSSLLTFVVGGGGFTGVELAGEFAERVAQLCQQHNIARHDVRLLIVEAQAHILPGYANWMVQHATASLTRLGVELVTGDPVAEVQAGCLRLQSGREIASGLLVWTGGVEAVGEAQAAGAETGRGGRLVVNQFMEALAFPSAYAVGDNAIMADTTQAVPSSAQLALQQAATVATNIFAEAQGQPQSRQPFKPKLAGEVISIGSHDAIANVNGLRLTGTPAVVLKNLIEQRYRLSLGKGPLAELAMATLV